MYGLIFGQGANVKPNDSYPDPDALYEERCEWWDYSVYDYMYRQWDGDNPFDDDEEEEEEDDLL